MPSGAQPGWAEPSGGRSGRSDQAGPSGPQQGRGNPPAAGPGHPYPAEGGTSAHPGPRYEHRGAHSAPSGGQPPHGTPHPGGGAPSAGRPGPSTAPGAPEHPGFAPGRQPHERDPQPWHEIPATPYAAAPDAEQSGPRQPHTFAQDSVAEAFLSGTPMPRPEAPPRTPEPRYDLPDPQAAAAPPATPPAPEHHRPEPTADQGRTRAPRVVGPPRPAVTGLVSPWIEEDLADPDAEETAVFLIMGADRRARAEKKEEEEHTAGPEAARPEPPAADPGTGPGREDSLLYRGASLFGPEAAAPAPAPAEAGAEPRGEAREPSPDRAPEGDPAGETVFLDAGAIASYDPARGASGGPGAPAPGTGQASSDAPAAGAEALAAASAMPDPGTPGLRNTGSETPAPPPVDDPAGETVFLDAGAIASYDPARGASGGFGAPAAGTGVPVAEGVSEPHGRAEDRGGYFGPAGSAGTGATPAAPAAEGYRQVSGGGAPRGARDAGLVSERGASTSPSPGAAAYLGSGDAASAFLSGRGPDSFTSVYAAPGGYEQRLASVKPVPTSVWKRAVFAATRGRVNPG
ncbi:hypothetical protein SUDANB121_02982 [Nocardiopsis dassonvillei]|uniref:hypothetical protein n=1 Tax=Nocardiopsis dassonvillei TaxID=2014 RepID=UPI003F57E0EF